MSPIDPIHLQRRHAEQGRIRLGHKVGENGRPSKLEKFRFTSPNRTLIDGLAFLYGGEVKPWDNDGIPSFEVYSDSKELPIVVVKGGVSQWFEHWTRAGIGHRCDGTKSDKGVECDPHDPLHVEATKKPTTRLSVMLPELDSTGVWRLETHGWNAAAELPMIGELAAYVGSMIPAKLSLQERRKVIQVSGKSTTSRFVVPVVDLEIKVRELAQLVSGTSPALIEGTGDPSRGQITSTAANPPDEAALAIQALVDLYVPQIEACLTTEDVRTLWRQIVQAGHLYPEIRQLLEARGEDVAKDPTGDDPVDPDEEAVEATLEPDEEEPPVDEPAGPTRRRPLEASDPIEDDRLWQDVMTAGGKKKMTAMEIVAAYTDWAGHPVDQGNARLYQIFIEEKLS